MIKTLKLWILLIIVAISLLVCSVVSPLSSEAKNLSDYQKEKSIATQKVQNEERLNQAERNRLARSNGEIVNRTNQKVKILANFKSKIERQGNQKIASSNQKLTALSEVKVQMNRVNQQYVRRQASQIQAYKNFITEFQAYKGQEDQKKEALRKNLLEAQQSQAIAAIASPRRMIRNFYYSEIEEQNKISDTGNAIAQKIRQAFREYEAEIAPFRPQMDKFTLRSLTPPTLILERLNQIIEYSNQRRAYFSRVIRSRFPEVEQQVTNIITNLVQNDLNEFEKMRIQVGISSAWGDLSNELAARKRQVFKDKKYRSTVGCGYRMRGFYDYYQEILSHKGKCVNIDLSTSPYGTGCAILKTFFTEAERFFSQTAWIHMGLSLFIAQTSAPKELSSLVKKLSDLKVHEHEGLIRPDLLLKAVKVHDQLVEEWAILLENNSTAPSNLSNEVENAS